MNEQITDKAISYIDRQKKAAPDKPFFLYYAPGATHAPHQVAAQWSDLYKGKFDGGWDAYRETVFARQKQLGIIPSTAVLPARNPNIKAWNKLSGDEKKLYARFMEVYAGYLTYTDHEIGRVVNHLKEINQLDNTLIFVIVGDNGASKEGTLNGDIDRLFAKALPEPDNIKYNLGKVGEIGTPEATEGNYPLGWAQAANTPFKHWKGRLVASIMRDAGWPWLISLAIAFMYLAMWVKYRLVARAQVIEARLSVGRRHEAILGTFTVAGETDLATAAIVRQVGRLRLAEGL